MKPLTFATLIACAALMTGCASASSAEHAAASTPAQCAATPDVDQEYTSSSGSRIEPLQAGTLTLCGYGQLPGVTLQAHQVVTDATAIEAIRSELNKGGSPRRNDKCANDSGAVIVEKFQGAGREVDLVQEVGGCERVSNGISAVFDGNTQAIALAMKQLPADYCREAFPGGEC